MNKNGDCISDKELGDAVAVSAADLIAQKEYPIDRELGIVMLAAMQYALEHSSSDASVIIDCIMSFLRHIDITGLQYMRIAVSERTPIEDPKNRWLNEEWEHLGFMIQRELRAREVK